MASAMVLAGIKTGLSARRLTGVAGVAWVVVTAIGVTSFSLVGSSPDFGNATAFAAYIAGSSTNFLIEAFCTGISAALLGAFVAGLSTLLLERADERLTATVLLVLGVIVATLLSVVGRCWSVSCRVRSSSF